MLTLQHAHEHGFGVFRRFHLERACACHAQAKVFGVNFVFTHHAVLEFTHQGACAQADFVQPIAAIDHQCMLGAQALQGSHLDADQIFVEHPHEDVGGARRIGQGAEDVEDGAHTQLLAHGGHVLHGRVVVGREHKTDAHITDAIRYS